MASSNARFMGITTPYKRAQFTALWNSLSAEGSSLLEALTAQVATFTAATVGDSAEVSGMSSNGHSASAFLPGANAATSHEHAEMWQGLSDWCNRANRFLKYCSTYGLDAFQVDKFGLPIPLPNPAQNKVVVDTQSTADQAQGIWDGDNWQSVCDEAGVDPASVVNQPVSDEAIYAYVLHKLVPVTEIRNDNFWLRISGTGMQYV